MKRFCLLAVLMLSAPLAHAGEGLSFSIGGHRIHIDSTRCRAQSCVSVSDRSRRDDGAGRALSQSRRRCRLQRFPLSHLQARCLRRRWPWLLRRRR